jgi:hypothetical protein
MRPAGTAVATAVTKANKGNNPKLGYHGISWENVDVNGLALFSYGKNQWFQ